MNLNRKTEILTEISNREVKLGVVGLGYVGLPLSISFAQVGIEVIGIDIDAEKVSGFNDGRSHVEDVPNSELRPLVRNGCFRASADFSDLTAVDAIAICLPTPLGETKDPDISFIISATDSIAKYGATGKLIILESTTYPGTTEDIILPRLTENGDHVGEDFFLAFSPSHPSIIAGSARQTAWNDLTERFGAVHE